MMWGSRHKYLEIDINLEREGENEREEGEKESEKCRVKENGELIIKTNKFIYEYWKLNQLLPGI